MNRHGLAIAPIVWAACLVGHSGQWNAGSRGRPEELVRAGQGRVSPSWGDP